MQEFDQTQEKKLKILFIAGSGRNGSTLLERILGGTDNVFSTGEICFLWERGLIKNRDCGCGIPFRECELWNRILQKAYGEDSRHIDPEEMRLYYQKDARFPRIPLMLMPWGKRVLSARLKNYLNNLEKLYWAIQSITEADVIVDSSKFPSYGYILGLIDSFELYIIHLIRDSRSVANSWRRRKLSQPGIFMDSFGPITSATQWNIFNFATEAFWRSNPKKYLQIRYEDFVNYPEVFVRKIFCMVGKEPLALTFREKNIVELKKNHTVSGNPIRFDTGLTEIRSDGKNIKIKGLDMLLVTSLTWPLLIKYGYSLNKII